MTKKMDNFIRIIDSNSLFKGSNVVEVVHKGTIYVMRITKDGKLILTK
ncbi:hemin uptake protein HemP [Arcobacter sp. FWKO B]|nr:hemin uptake protein HemP [Arcobacter sp. FWKO B]QOG12773.1 hemin uptake protein HemP [Arcobacter sp. FWKO B]QOG12787.1 hemin uptake protein HemP [Arcobacter sp. FWKO B]